MKVIYFLALLFIFDLALATNGIDQNDSSTISLDSIAEAVKASKVFKVVGVELIPPNGARYSLAKSQSLLAALTKLDLPAITRLVTVGTDYECLSGKDYFIILPKDDPAKHEIATAKLRVRINQMDNTPFMEILTQISKINSIKRPIVMGPSWPMGEIKGDSISLKAGTYTLYDVLNEMAIQLKANSWSIDHLGIYKGPNQPVFPIILNPGFVSFYFP